MPLFYSDCNINGKLNGSVMYAAKLCNVNEIINLSGASAIAALSIGTKKIKPVDIITGPGSKYVAIAKRILSYKNFIAQERMYAGESEIVCWCDDTASPDEIAYSLLAQSEHSDGVLSIMISKDFKLYCLNYELGKVRIMEYNISNYRKS